jgi:hypothetical protein
MYMVVAAEAPEVLCNNDTVFVVRVSALTVSLHTSAALSAAAVKIVALILCVLCPVVYFLQVLLLLHQQQHLLLRLLRRQHEQLLHQHVRTLTVFP